MPKVSVIMPVYNAGHFLSESIESILNQTERDFEFIIINDGSTDNTEAIVRRYTDSRIRYLTNSANAGITESLNLGISEARGNYLARMDADDIAMPERLSVQLAFMESHRDVGVCGSWVEYFGKKTGIIRAPVSHSEIVWTMMFGSPFFHPSVIIRKEVLVDHHLVYPLSYPHAEDYALWIQLTGLTKFANLPQVLLRYRIQEESVSARFKTVQLENGVKLRRNILERLTGRQLTSMEWPALDMSGTERLDLRRLEALLCEVNEQNGLFGVHDFRKVRAARVKQMTLKRKLTLSSYFLLVQRSIHDFSFAKYLVISTFRKSS